MNIILRIIHDLTQVHPPHTMIVHFPIALTGAALFFILLALWLHSDLLEKVAFANISLAAVSTIVAAIFGIRDNLTFYAGRAPNHTAKIILAIILFSITTATAVIRWRKPDLFQNKSTRALYVVSYFVSFAIAAVLGFFGGIILFGF
jgi:uncharacterized membrane protein